jgi:NhaC family Na+:H+ antiporter
MLIAFTLYLILGLFYNTSRTDLEKVNPLSASLHEQFDLTPLLLVAPISILVLLAFKIPALPAILAGGPIRKIFGIWIQGITIGDMLTAMRYGYVSETGSLQQDIVAGAQYRAYESYG